MSEHDRRYFLEKARYLETDVFVFKFDPPKVVWLDVLKDHLFSALLLH